MSARESQLETLLHDLLICAANACAKPRNTMARAELRRSVNRGRLWLKSDRDRRRAGELDPRDPRPAPPVPEAAPPVPPQAAVRSTARLPYKDD